MPKFKFQEIMDALGVPCPTEDFETKETIAFRWVFENMADERNFLPQYFKDPVRFFEKPPKIKCQAIGLSFFDSEENAINRFRILTARMSAKKRKTIGTRLANGNILKTDGLTCLADVKGHFTHYPFEETDFANRFLIVADL